MNEVVQITEPLEVLEQWPFFDQGRKALNDPRRSDSHQSPEQYFSALVRTVQLGADGLLVLLQSRNAKPLGYGGVFVTEDFAQQRFAFVWTAYSTGRCDSTMSELLTYAKSWARDLGLPEIKMSSQRLSGAVDRYWRSLGFTLEYKSFTQPTL